MGLWLDLSGSSDLISYTEHNTESSEFTLLFAVEEIQFPITEVKFATMALMKTEIFYKIPVCVYFVLEMLCWETVLLMAQL